MTISYFDTLTQIKLDTQRMRLHQLELNLPPPSDKKKPNPSALPVHISCVQNLG